MKKISAALFLALIATASVSCGPSAKDVSTAVMGTLQGWTAIPSYTLQPTFTAMPTYTKFPTYTELPTYTKYPSPFPIPTDVPAGKQTPYPTYHTGTYARDELCVIAVVQDLPRYIIIDLACNIGPPSYNSGGLFQVIYLQGDVAVFSTKEWGGSCIIQFNFQDDTIYVNQVSQSAMYCGFGHGVYVDGTFVLISRARPRLGCMDPDNPCGWAHH